MNFNKANQPNPITIWDRWAHLFGKLVILFILVYIPLVFWPATWANYTTPKTISMQSLALLVFGSWAILAMGRRMIRSAIAIPAAVYFFIVVFTTLITVNMAEAYPVILFTAACLGVMVLASKYFVRFRDFHLFVYIMGLLSIVVSTYAMAQHFQWQWYFNAFERFGLRNLYPNTAPVATMGNINYAAEWMNIAVPILFCMMLNSLRRPFEFLFFGVCILFSAASLIYIDCNAAYAGFMVAIPVMLLTFIYHRVLPAMSQHRLLPTARPVFEQWYRHGVVVLVFVVALGAFFVASVPNPVREKLTTTISWVDIDDDRLPDGNSSVIFRLMCMDATIRKIADQPILGIGPGNFKVIHPYYETQLERKVLGRETLARKAHNDHLQNAAEYGIFGLFAWYWILAAVAFSIFYCLRHLRMQDLADRGEREGDLSHAIQLPREERSFYFFLQLGVLGAIIVTLVNCLFGHTFVIPSSAATFWTVAGISVAAFQRLHRSHRGVQQPVLGSTPERLTPVQQITQKVHPALRWGIIFGILLVPGAYNTYQFVGETWLRMAMTKHDQKKYAEMFHSFNKAMHYYPYQMETFYIMGRYYIDAAGIVRKAEAAGGDNQFTIYTNAQMPQVYRGDEARLIREGIVCLQTDIYMNPNYKWAHNNLGVLYDRMSEVREMPESPLTFDLAKSAYERVFAVDAEQIFAHFNLGLGYYRQGDYQNAIRSLEMALVIDPNYTDVYQYLALSFLGINDYERAMMASDKYVANRLLDRVRGRINDTNRDTYEPLLAALRQGDYLSAIEQGNSLAGFADDQAFRIYLQMAYSLYQNDGNDQLTEEAIHKADAVAQTITPNQLMVMGDMLSQLGNKEAAAEKYQRYLDENPEDAAVRRKLTQLYLDAQAFEQAVETFEPIIASNNATHVDIINQVRMMLSTGEYSWADVFPYLQRSVEVGGDEAREMIIQPQHLQVFQPFIQQDPRMQQLLGESFLTQLDFLKPQSAEPASATASPGEASPLPAESIPAATQSPDGQSVDDVDDVSSAMASP